MPDSKITALTSISTSTDPANDPLVIVDVSDTSMAATGTTKKVTLNNLLACSPTATLASATITGDLTVDTSTLKVDSGNNRVGVNTASPVNTLHVNGEVTLPINNLQYWNGYYSGGFKSVAAGYAGYTAFATNGDFVLANTDASAAGAGSALTFYNRYRISNAGIHTWETVGGVAGTAMTLNSTGLGIGVTPNRNLDIRQDQSAATIARIQNQSVNAAAYAQLSLTASGNNWGILVGSSAANSNRLEFVVDPSGTNLSVMRLDTSGQVGIGVNPSASWTGSGVIQQQNGAVYANSSLGSYDFSYNSIRTASNSYVYAASSLAAARFQLRDGAFNFFTAPSSGVGGAGNAITFTQSMTLDASGNLLVGTTTNGGNGVSIRPSTASPNVVLVGSDTSGGTSWQLYSTGTSSNRFYVTWAGVVNAVNTTISGISDARLKENVQDIDVGLGAILALKPRKFDWKAGKGKDIKGDRGFIAQEFEQVFPQLVDEWADPAPEGEAPYKSVRQDLIPVLVKAIQELAAEVNALKNA